MIKSGNNIMMIDYDEEIVNIVTRLLELEGYDITAVSDGGAALALLEENKPNFGIQDITMVDMDGYAVCQCIREHSDIPIILVSSISIIDEEEIEKAAIDSCQHIATSSSEESLAKIREMLRGIIHPNSYPNPEFHCHALVIDLNSQKAKQASGTQILLETAGKP